jgi:hypothetical protein
MSLAATQLIGFGAKRAAATGGDATIAYASTASKSVPASPATFTAAGIGTAAANRYVIVALSGYRSTNGNVPTVTVGGTSITHVATADTATFEAYIYAGNITSGTTADVIATYTGAWVNLNCSIWAAYGIASTTAYHTDSDLTATTTMTAAINIPAGGVAVAIHGNNNAGAQTWTGLTEDFDSTDVTTRQCTGASLASATLQTGLSISVTNTSGDGVLLVASWDN